MENNFECWYSMKEIMELPDIPKYKESVDSIGKY